MLKFFILKQIEALEKQLSLLSETINSLPTGEFFCFKNGKYIKWFVNDGSKVIYISKKDAILAKQLAIQKYLKSKQHYIKGELQILNNSLAKLEKLNDKSEQLTKVDSPYAELINSYYQIVSDEYNEWINEPYDKNTNHPENLLHKTLSGYIVRSKSEVLIANALFTNKIPFRYECPLNIGDILVYPDFTILHPRTHKKYYWEHFGMMDNEKYSDNAYAKLKDYAHNSIIPTINLITTFETKQVPLDCEQIQKIIDEYFK